MSCMASFMKVKQETGVALIFFLCCSLSPTMALVPQTTPCNQVATNKEEGEHLRSIADGLLAKVQSGNDVARNLQRLRDLLCRQKGRPRSISYQYILLVYAKAEIARGKHKEAAKMLANEASEGNTSPYPVLKRVRGW